MAERSTASATILAVSLEFAAVGVFTVLAGANEQSGNIMLIFMVGLWLVFLVSESNIIESALAAFTSLSSNPQNKG